MSLLHWKHKPYKKGVNTKIRGTGSAQYGGYKYTVYYKGHYDEDWSVLQSGIKSKTEAMKIERDFLKDANK